MKEIEKEYYSKINEDLDALEELDAIPEEEWDGPMHDPYIAVKKLAQLALDYSRNCFRLKSPNKVYINKDAPHVVNDFTRSTYRDDICKHALIDLQRNEQYSSLGPLQRAAFIDSLTRDNQDVNVFAGNCDQLAESAFYYISKYGRFILGSGSNQVRVRQVGLKNPTPFGHTWVILQYINDNTADINPEWVQWAQINYGIVCDPWANIICHAIDFKSNWVKKMQKYSSRGKYICTLNGPTNPIEPCILNFLDKPLIVINQQDI
ncbi:hypothetical protein [Yersinia kristensenii]|uniref:hypothetical protein n=1 Tax=Yersinia kristensenii TaxID=28152 RepID=UPI0005E22858|nr:hypothetical protein [Yersinia kristensenii]CNH29120.1 Uncharacterised protein [Yersinia kristensenii]CNK62786.1 Uncharacterised protein [Yersinia kristensenii]